MELMDISPGEKRNRRGSLAEIDLNLCNPEIKETCLNTLCKNKSKMVAHEEIESADCVKVTDSKGNWLYFRTELFNYVKGRYIDVYLTDDWKGTKILIGINNKQLVIVAPLRTDSVEMYI